MQPTDRMEPGSARALPADGGERRLLRDDLDSPQPMRMSLDGRANVACRRTEWKRQFVRIPDL